ncbi:MAG: GAF domain-containing sensor histidine kinase [Methanobacteriota archaeon]|nr:MAG: GAF domain-containing sensor histidine kinase [Euryarchaeota archaeon]
MRDVLSAVKSTTRAGMVRFVVYSEDMAREMGRADAGSGRDADVVLLPDHRVMGEDSLVTGRSHFSRPEVWPSSADAGSADTEWREGDWLRIPLEEGRGDSVACIEVLATSDGALLSASDVERLELLADLAAVAVSGRKELMQQEQLSDSMRERTDLLEDLLMISSSIVSERSPGALSNMVLSSLSTLFGFQRVSLIVFDDTVGEFRWQGVFGYPEEVVRSAISRTIPADLVLEELTPANRLSRSAYFIRFEDVSERSRRYFVIEETSLQAAALAPRSGDEMREGDSIAFALRDSAGRIAGAIYASMPRDGRKPDGETIETIEIFTSLAEVAIEDARLSLDRESALRASGQRTEQLSRIFDLTSELMYVRDLDHLLGDVLKTLAQLLGIRRAVIGVKDEDRGTFVVKAVHGYPDENVEGIKKVEYAIERIHHMLSPDASRYSESPVHWRRKVGRNTYYAPAESIKRQPEDDVYYPEEELISHPRKSRAHWHALDYLDTFIFDREGEVIAYIEILQPRDDRVPDAETIEVIEIFASLVGIAIENSRHYESQVENRRSAEFYTDLLSHDIKNFNQAMIGYLDMVKEHLSGPEEMALVEKILDQVLNVSRLANDVRTMSKLTWGGVSLSRVDLGSVLTECVNSVKMYYMNRTIEVKHSIEPGRHYVKADELLREVFTNLLTNAVRYDPSASVVIDVGVEHEADGDHKWVTVSITDRGCGVPDELKESIFRRFSQATERRGSTGLGLHIVTMLAKRYGGSTWVENRVEGDYTQGSVFIVRLPEY